ncbi:MAG TPA: molybdopterin molybdotransferase MoeA [Methanoregulaceae archaeon]|nr:molybdopterin molybdotransferase MoeA [Methanoregulaceae archaeon]
MNRSYQESRQLPPFSLARERIIAAFPAPRGTVDMPVDDSVGRILAAPVHAGFAMPSTDVAEVDGIAVASRETITAAADCPVVIETGARVNTGQPLPPRTDAVVPIECCAEGSTRLALEAPIDAGGGVRRAGTELEDGALLLPAGHRLRPIDVGPLVAAGVTYVQVRAVRVGVIPTGGELVLPGTMPGPGESVASNPDAIRALLAPHGAETTAHTVVPDDPEAVNAAIEAFRAKVDIVIVCGGSGRGTRDVVFSVVRSLGEIIVDGVAARPGRAFLMVRAGDLPVVALPGRPQPVGLLTEYFIVPLLAAWGLPAAAPPRVRVRLGLGIESHPRFAETVPLSVGRVGKNLIGIRQPRGRQGTRSQFRANARLRVPEAVAGYAPSDDVEVELLDDPDGPDMTVLVVGAVEEIDLPGTGPRIAVVPCSQDEARALLDRSSCHLAVLEGAPCAPCPSWPLRLESRGDVWFAAPPRLVRDPKVRAALSALGITRC